MKKTVLISSICVGLFASTAWAEDTTHNHENHALQAMEQSVANTPTDKQEQKMNELRNQVAQANDTVGVKHSEVKTKVKQDIFATQKNDVFAQSKADVFSDSKPDAFAQSKADIFSESKPDALGK